MSNLALNIIPTVNAAQKQGIAGEQTTVTKKNAANITSSQDDSQQVLTAYGKSNDSTSSAKVLQKVSFTEMLQKRLAGNTSQDKSDASQTKKQVFDNTVLTSEKQNTDTKSQKKTTENLLSSVLFTPQSLDVSQKQTILVPNNIKSSKIQSTKAVQTQQTVTDDRSKVYKNKEVTIKKATNELAKETAKEGSKESANVTQKIAKDAAEIKNISAENPSEKVNKASVSECIIGSEQKTKPSQHKQIQELTTPKEITIEEKPKVKESSLSSLKTQFKVNVTKTEQQTDVVQNVSAPRETELIQPRSNSHFATEPISPQSVTAQTSEKVQAFQSVPKPSEQLIEQIQNRITGNVQEIRVTLKPAVLGSVRITFRQQDGQIDGLLEVQSLEVRKDIEKAMPQIAAVLAQNGIQVRRMDIAPMQNHQQSNQEALQSPEHDFDPTDHRYLTEQSGHSPSKGSETGFQGQAEDDQSDLAPSTANPVYNLSNLNMFA